MPNYKNILSGYVNERRDGDGHYLAITNVSDEVVTIQPGEKIYLNRTPSERLEQYPNIPHYSKSVKIEDKQENEESQEYNSEEVADDIPF